MNLAALALLPAALLVDRLFGEPPSRLHPVCLIGAFAARVETLLRRGPNGARMFLSGALACLLAALPSAAAAGGWSWRRNAAAVRARAGLRRWRWYTSALPRAASANTPTAWPFPWPGTTSKARVGPYP